MPRACPVLSAQARDDTDGIRLERDGFIRPAVLRAGVIVTATAQRSHYRSNSGNGGHPEALTL